MDMTSSLAVFSLGNVTSADLIVYATCQDVAPTQFRVTEFADGGGIGNDSRERAVTRMGIDFKFVYGIVGRPEGLTFTMLPTSPYLKVVYRCMAMQYKRRAGLKWTLSITYPAIGMVFDFSEGVIVNAPSMPDAQDTLANVAVQYQLGNVDTHFIGEGNY